MPAQFKEDRKICHDARDKFWQCLELNNEEAEKCKALRKEFEKSCPSQWVSHFDRKRKYEKFKEHADEIKWYQPPRQNTTNSSV